MGLELKEKFENFAELIIFIVFDTFLVLFVALMTHGLKLGIEYIYGQPLDDINNFALITIFKVSKILLIFMFCVYAIIDIFKEIKKKILK